jgi:twitching motility protein PilT
VTQQLVPTTDGLARVAAVEVLVCTPAVRNLIREGKTHQIYSSMQAGGRYGMQTMDMSLAQHIKAGRVSQQIAFERCHDPEELQRLLGGSFTSGPSDGYDSPAAFGSSYEGSGGMLMGG